MGKDSAIEWTDHTFNPWWGCVGVSPACDFCYAQAWAHRLGMDSLWEGDRRFFGDAHWREPMRWARKVNGHRPRVFCASMADVFDNHRDVEASRGRLWDLISRTPEFDWLLLTKRIGNTRRMLPYDWSAQRYPNVWLGISVVNQEELSRDVPKLLEIPAAVRFLSCEPLLGPLEFGSLGSLQRLHWVICGGESGPKARPMATSWALRLREQCSARGIAFFMKQGSQANWSDFKNIDGFLPELRVREWPRGPSPQTAEQPSQA